MGISVWGYSFTNSHPGEESSLGVGGHEGWIFCKKTWWKSSWTEQTASFHSILGKMKHLMLKYTQAALCCHGNILKTCHYSIYGLAFMLSRHLLLSLKHIHTRFSVLILYMKHMETANILKKITNIILTISIDQIMIYNLPHKYKIIQAISCMLFLFHHFDRSSFFCFLLLQFHNIKWLQLFISVNQLVLVFSK